MPTRKEIHDKITQQFYAAKRDGKITVELQSSYDTIHAENWLLKDKEDMLAANASTDTTAVDNLLVTTATSEQDKTALKAIIGDWTK
jgi:hypothetical protein